MGDWYQTIADVQATPDESADLAATVLAWLVDAGIVLGEPTDCVLSGEGQGYPPGPNYAAAVTEAEPHLLALRTNGVAVVTGRTVFYSMGADTVTCPACGRRTELTDEDGEPNDAWHELSDTISVWFDGGSGTHACPNCRNPVELNDWTWSPPWGFGHLGFTFWNWPPLNPQFLAEAARRLGHRTVYPVGKL